MKKKIKESVLHYQVFFRAEPEGGYTAIVPSLAGCISYGETIDEAKIMIQDAIGLYVESLIENNEPVPEDEMVFVSTVQLLKPHSKVETYA